MTQKRWSKSHWTQQISAYLDYHSQLRPKWKRFYVSYDHLIHFLDVLTPQSPEEHHIHLFETFDDEVEKVVRRYVDQLDKADQLLEEYLKWGTDFDEQLRPFRGLIHTKTQLKEAYIELYQSVEFLASYVKLNRHAILDIQRGYAQLTSGREDLANLEKLNFEPFQNQERLNHALSHIQQQFSDEFVDDVDRENATYILRTRGTHHSDNDVFKLAFAIGVCVPLIGLILYFWFVLSPPTDRISGFWDTFPVFRCTFLFIWYAFLYGIDVFVWRKFSINHAFLLEFNPKTHILNHVTTFKLGTFLLVLWATCIFLWIGVSKKTFTFFGLEAKYLPLICILGMLLFLFLPVHFFHLSSRVTLLKTLGELFRTPFGYCRFRETFAADVCTSMVIPLADVSYIFCYYFSNAWQGTLNQNVCFAYNAWFGSIIALWPYGCRFVQCLRHAIKEKRTEQYFNAGKYLSALAQITISWIHKVTPEASHPWAAIHILWIISVAFSALYCYVWDLLMDWGLFECQKVTTPDGKTRRRIGFRKTRRFHILYYILSAIANLFGRFAWVGTLSYTFIGKTTDFLKIVFGAIELARRTNWAVIRLEYAQISNARKYRKTEFVPEMLDA